jgi:hypothetical protein
MAALCTRPAERYNAAGRKYATEATCQRLAPKANAKDEPNITIGWAAKANTELTRTDTFSLKASARALLDMALHTEGFQVIL